MKIKSFGFLLIFFINTILLLGQDTIRPTLLKFKPQKALRFGFNLDWDYGYNHAKSNASKEFLGIQPMLDLLGGSFDLLYKNKWIFNFSWKMKQNYFRMLHRFTPPNDSTTYNNVVPLNSSKWGYNKTIVPINTNDRHEAFGFSIGRYIFCKSKWQQYLDFGLRLNLFEFYERSTFNPLSVIYEKDPVIPFLGPINPIYALQIYTNPSPRILDNRFLPNLYNDNGLKPILGSFLYVDNSAKYYQISYKIAYTAYYPMAKGKVQLLVGLGFEYFPFPFLVSDYTLYSKYDNINTSGTFSRSLTNAFVKLGFRFGKMGVEHFRRSN